MVENLIQSGVIFGLISVISWGVGDFFVAITSRKIGNISTVFWLMVFASLGLSAYIASSQPNIQFSLTAIGLSLIAGLFHAVANTSFAQGLKVGKVSLVAPVAAGYSLILIAAAILVFGERLTRLQFTAVALVIIGTILASTNIKELFKTQRFILSDPGIPYALTTFFFWGIGFLFLNQAIEQVSWELPNLVLYLTQAILVFTYARLRREKIRRPQTASLWGIAALAGTGAAGGYIGYSIGIETGLIAVVAPVSAAFPAVTVLLARIFFREELNLYQAIGISSIIGGVILLSI